MKASELIKILEKSPDLEDGENELVLTAKNQ